MQRWCSLASSAPFLAMALLAGCSLSEDKFAEDFTQAECEWAVTCYPGVYTSVEECVSDGSAIESPADDCTYDPKAARDCLKGTQDLACPDDGSFPERPAACDEVYTCGSAG